MTDFYSKTSFVINCDHAVALVIEQVLNSLQCIFNEAELPNADELHLMDEIRKGGINPGPGESLQTRLWKQLVSNRIKDAIEPGKADRHPPIMDLIPFEFAWELSASENDWSDRDGIHLFDDDAYDDIFDVASDILKVLCSDEIIMTGIAHTASKPGPGNYGGDSVVISADGWELLTQPGDQDALATKMRDQVNYWLMTAEGADTGHPQGAIYRTNWEMTAAEAAEACRQQRQMPIDTATKLRPTTYENLREVFPVIDAEDLKEMATA